jgi:ATP-binding cassette subfamily G (WHITE) protein 2 (PDR)
MSFSGSNAFTSYDRTAKSSGSPYTSPHHEMQGDDENILKKTVSNISGRATRPRTTSAAAMEKDSSPGSGTSHEGDDSELERRESIVQALARRYTSHSHVGGGTNGKNPFLDNDENSPLNPHSPDFNARAWTKAIVDMDTGALRTSGVCFQHLNVHGFGAATDYQKDVANVSIFLGSVTPRAGPFGRPTLPQLG